MPIVFSRIDDRLLHGQVVTTWIKEYQIEQCVVVNGQIFEDTFQRQLLEMAAPANMRVVFYSPQKFAEIAAANPIKRRTMLLFNNPADVLYLVEHGVDIQALNIGGMKNDGKKRQLSAAVAVTDQDVATLQKIADAGVEITIRMVPQDKELRFEKAIQN